MVYGLLLQWTVIILTIFILIWIGRGKSTMDKRALIVFAAGSLLINVGYLFELMADGKETAFMSLELSYAGVIFMGYFFCLFFCYHTINSVPRWVAVYGLVFDILMLILVWTSRWHPLIFENVSYEQVTGSYILLFTRGKLYSLLFLGCELFPAAVALVTVFTYMSRLFSLRARRKIFVKLVVMLLIYGTSVAFSMRLLSVCYDFLGALSLVLIDAFAVYFWFKAGFNLERESEETAFDSMREGVIVMDASMALLSYNAAAKRMFPELELQIINHSLKRLRSIPLDFFEQYDEKEVDLGDRHYKVRNCKVRDHWKEVRGYVLILDDQTKEYNYLAEIVRGRKQAENAQEDALRALEEANNANRIKSDFLSNVSHEIRTPMNAIVGLSELIIEESRGRKVYDFACDIKNASTNLLAIINDILSLSKIEAGQMTLEQKAYGTEQLLDETLHLAKMSASTKGLQLKRSISPKLPCRLVGDEMRIRQMITNFLDFGMKYTDRGYVKVTVTHKWVDGENVLLIYQFEDTGEGFSPEDVKGLFDQFQRMDERKDRNLESIGLGLAITKRFVDLMDGSVEVTSEPGKGTIFTVCFPQKVADARSIKQQPRDKLDVKAAVNRAFVVPDYKVLVVDDNKINLKVAGGALASYRFQVEEAKSGQQAIDMAKRTAYDMIFMDHMMPEMDGIEATVHIRSECGENGKKPVIIALSANVYNNAREMFLSNGFQDFIAKPLDKDELHEVLCKWIPAERRQIVEGTPEAEKITERAEMAKLFMVGVDVAGILKKHSGEIKDYLDLLELYYMDGEEKSELIKRLAQEEDYKNYEIQVHGLKSASANIGANEFSELAKSHEFAAKEGNYQFIRDGVAKLLAEYQFLLHEIERTLGEHGYLREENEDSQSEQLSAEETRRRMEEILNDVENFRSKDAAEGVEALLKENIEKSALECLKDVRNRLKMYDDDTAEDLLRSFLA